MSSAIDEKSPLSLATQRDGTSAMQADGIYRKVTFKLIPFLFVCYVLCFVARINISFAQLQFKADLAFSDAVYGFGAGLFYLGYILFEVPSNIMLEKIGARATIMRIMVLWGIVSAAMSLISSPTQFYAARFLLGVMEAGFFPGIILYLTYWYPSHRRGQILAIFLSATAVSGVISAPLSTWLMSTFDGVYGLKGWQWMFIVEGTPSILFGIIACFYLSDRPSSAGWLTEQEKRVIADDIAAEQNVRSGGKPESRLAVFLDPRVYLISFVYFAMASAFAVFVFWFPSMVKELDGASLKHIGILSMIPYVAALIGMIVVGRHSDRKLERRWHLIVCILVAALSLIVSTMMPLTIVTLVVVQTIFACAINAAAAVFWTVPTVYLSHVGVARGVALISSIGQLGNFFSPTLLGKIKVETGSLAIGVNVMAVLLIVAAIAILLGLPERLIKERRQA